MRNTMGSSHVVLKFTRMPISHKIPPNSGLSTSGDTLYQSNDVAQVPNQIRVFLLIRGSPPFQDSEFQKPE